MSGSVTGSPFLLFCGLRPSGRRGYAVGLFTLRGLLCGCSMHDHDHEAPRYFEEADCNGPFEVWDSAVFCE